MPSMPGTVTRTKTFRAMDKIWSNSPESFMYVYDQMDFKTLLDKAPIDDLMKDHVKKHWLDENGYFGNTEAQDVLQRGLYWAMRVAAFHEGDLQRRRMDPHDPNVPKPLPISCAWVCSGGKPEGGWWKLKKKKYRFEMVSLESEYQVTLLFLTPPPEDATYAKDKDHQPVWATRHFDFEVWDDCEDVLETWPTKDPTTRTVRPYDSESFPTP